MVYTASGSAYILAVVAEPIYPLRLSQVQKARWMVAADGAGVALAEFIREAVEARIDGRQATVPPVAAAPDLGGPNVSPDFKSVPQAPVIRSRYSQGKK